MVVPSALTQGCQPFVFFFLYSLFFFQFIIHSKLGVHELIQVKFVLDLDSITSDGGRTEPAIDQEGMAVWMARVPTNGHQMSVKVNKLKQQG